MVQLKDIVKIYNKGKSNEFEALHGVSAEIKDGEMIAIVGTSGAGKSTLLHILGFIDRYDKGEYILDGTPVGKMNEIKMAHLRNEKIGMIMQDFALIEDYTVQIGSIKYAQKKGIRIPEDLSVMGYNNSMLTNCCTPELTSVDNRLETQTHQLVQTLLGVLAGEEMPKKSIFSGKIIKRGTTLF